MKVLLLFIAASLNCAAWFDTVITVRDIMFFLPLFSIIISVIALIPQVTRGRIEFKIVYFAVFGMIYFNAPLYFTAIFDPNELSLLLRSLRISELSFIKANFLFGISLPLICAGYLMFEIRSISRITYTRLQNKRKLQIKPYTIGLFVFLILSLGVTGLEVGSTYIGTSSYYYIILTRLALISVAIVLYNGLGPSAKIDNFKSILLRNKITSLGILLFVTYVLIGGDRGPALTAISMLMFGYILLNRMSVKIRDFFLGGILLLVISTLFSFVEILRTFEGEVDLEILAIAVAASQDAENTAGVMIRTTSLAVDGISTGLYDHTYGLFIIQSVLKGIPFVGDFVAGTLTDTASPLTNGSAHLLTLQYSGTGYTSGIGTTFLADTYIEFGVVGIVIISLIYGIIAAKFHNNCKNLTLSNFSLFLLILLFVGYSFYTGRGTFWAFLPHFIHTWIFYMLIKILAQPTKFLLNEK